MSIRVWKLYCVSLISNDDVFQIYKNTNNFILVRLRKDYLIVVNQYYTHSIFTRKLLYYENTFLTKTDVIVIDDMVVS